MAPVATQHHEEAQSQIIHLSQGQSLRTRMHPDLSGLRCYSMTSGPQVRAMSGSMVLLQPGLVLMSSRVGADVQCCHHGRSCRHPRSRVKLVPQGHTTAGASGGIQTQLLPRTMLGLMVLPWLGSELKSRSMVTQRPRNGATTQGLGGVWQPHSCQNQSRLSGHSFYSDPRYCPSPCCYQGPHLGPWPSHSWGVC